MTSFQAIYASIPTLGWWVIAILVVSAIAFAIQALRDAARIKRAATAFQKALGTAQKAAPEERRRGRTLEAIDRVRQAARSLAPLPAGWWQALDEAIAPYRQPRGEEGFFLTTSADAILTEDRVIGSVYHGRLQAAVPGLLTSVGLLGTFLAILVGLAGLKPDPNTETVAGVAGLVSSLSGKFATSVAALMLSAIYLLFEHWMLGRLRATRRQLVAAVDAAIPTLTLTHVLLDVRTESLKQSESLGNISSDMAMAFAERFQEELGPEMARQFSVSVSERLGPSLGTLTETMERISEVVATIGREKQDSIVGELRTLIGSMEETLRVSLGAMGEEFRTALTGSTRDEFANVAKALEGSAGVLQSMNDGFASMQGTLQGLIEESRRTTELQMASGSERAESLNRLVEGLLVRLNESASQNASHVQGVLASVVSDLSTRVTALSDELVEKVGAATAASQAAAADTVRAATASSTRTAEEVAALIEELRGRVQDFEAAGTTLRDTQAFVQRTLDQNATGLRALQDAAAKVEMLSASLQGTATNLTRTQETQLRTAEAARGQLVKLEEMSRHHDDCLRQYNIALQNAQQLFGQLDDKLGATLDLILDRMQQYNGGVERNFETIMRHVNETMPSMGNILHSATEELRDQVEELTDTIQALRRVNGAGVR